MAKPLDLTRGYWFFGAFERQGNTDVIAGTYAGVSLFNSGKKGMTGVIGSALFESARFLPLHRGIIWAAQPYKGIFKITVAEIAQLMNVSIRRRNCQISIAKKLSVPGEVNLTDFLLDF